jgi:DNA-binding LacI/PurR family transcriptional regulator
MGTTALKGSKARIDSAEGWSKRRSEEIRVLKELEELCDREQPGARIPTHTELMRRFGGTERAILRALDDLKTRGRIVRRHGSGTYIAQPGGLEPIAAMGPDAASKTIVVIAKPDHGFFDDCLSQLYSHADSHDYEIVYQLLRSQQSAIADLRPIIGSAAGFILFGYQLAPLAKSLAVAGNRVVVVGAPDIDVVPDIPCVCNDHEAGGYLAVNHLIAAGHRRIAFTQFYEHELRNPRWQGCRRAMNEARRSGLTIFDSTIERVHLDEWGADPASAREVFAPANAPTAIVAWNDFTAAQLMDILRRAKVRIPDDVSIIGYDNLAVASTLTPALTTIDSGVAQLLTAAIRIVLAPKGGAPIGTQMTIPNLVVRDSVSEPES